MLYFGKREDNDDLLKQVDLAPMVAEELVLCLRAAKATHAVTPTTTDIAPSSRLRGSDPWLAYGITTEDTFVVADKYGNEFKRTDSRELAASAKEVGEHFRTLRVKMKEDIATAEKAFDAGKVDDALVTLRAVFAKGLVGYSECAAAETLYKKTLESGRKELEQSASDADKLKALSKRWQGTLLATDIAKAMQALETNARKK